MVLSFLLGYILWQGLPNIETGLFALQYNSENVSLFPALVDTVLMVIMALAIATPLGIFAAVYLVEYASRGNRLVSLVRVTADTLAGIPSILPMERITPARIPGTAEGRTTAKTVRSLPAPKP